MSRRRGTAARFTTILALLGLLTVTACSASEPPGGAPVGLTLAQRDTYVPGIANYAVISKGLSRGGQPDADGFQYLKDQGVRTIVNFREKHSERREVEALGMTIVEIPIRANILDCEPPTDEQVQEFFDILRDPARHPVFFHCAHGRDRTGTMAALYRIEFCGWTNDQAIEEMQVFGFRDMFDELIEYVRKYRPHGPE